MGASRHQVWRGWGDTWALRVASCWTAACPGLPTRGPCHIALRPGSPPWGFCLEWEPRDPLHPLSPLVRVWREKRTGQGRGSGVPCLPPVPGTSTPAAPSSSRPLCWCQRRPDSIAWLMPGPGPPFHLPSSPSSSLVPTEEFWPNEVKGGGGAAPYLPHGATWARPFPSFLPLRSDLPMVWSKGLTLPSRKQMEPSLTFSPLLSPGMGQTSFFGLAPSPLTDGDQPAPAPQEKGGAF